VGPYGMVAMYRLTASGSLSRQKARWMASSQVNVWGQMLGNIRGGLYLVPMLAKEVALDFENEVLLRLVC